MDAAGEPCDFQGYLCRVKEVKRAGSASPFKSEVCVKKVRLASIYDQDITKHSTTKVVTSPQPRVKEGRQGQELGISKSSASQTSSHTTKNWHGTSFPVLKHEKIEMTRASNIMYSLSGVDDREENEKEMVGTDKNIKNTVIKKSLGDKSLLRVVNQLSDSASLKLSLGSSTACRDITEYRLVVVRESIKENNNDLIEVQVMKLEENMKEVQDTKNCGLVHWGGESDLAWVSLEPKEKVEDLDDLLIEEVEVLGRARSSKKEEVYVDEVELSDDDFCDLQKTSNEADFIDDDSDDWEDMVQGLKKNKGNNNKFGGKGKRLGSGRGKIDKKSSRLITPTKIKTLLDDKACESNVASKRVKKDKAGACVVTKEVTDDVGECPMCQKFMKMDKLEGHAYDCQGVLD